jgi:hypothetical protein
MTNLIYNKGSEAKNGFKKGEKEKGKKEQFPPQLISGFFLHLLLKITLQFYPW